MKRNLAHLLLRLFIVVALVMSIFGFSMPALAAGQATVNQARDPSPANYVLNDGSATELFWWQSSWTSTPTYLSHIIENPVGTVVHTDSWNITGASSPIYNPEDPTGAHYADATQPDYAHKWVVPAGSVPGTYTSRVRYYSVEVSGATVPPSDLLAFEAESAVTFFVRQTWDLFKYGDLNGNGHFDNGTETGLNGWNFTITGPDNSTPFPGPSHTYSGTTSGGGFITLPDVAVRGDYTITETLVSGWRNTEPGGAAPYSKVVTLPLAAVVGQPYDPRVYFGNQQLATLEIFKFNDLDNNTLYGNGEPALSGWSYTITGPDNYSSSGTTNNSGLVTKTGLLPGQYVVTETVQSGWTVTTGNPRTGTVTTGTTRLNFGNYHPAGSLIIFKFNDLDQDGLYDAVDGELPLSGWSYTITGPSYSSSGVTDSNGIVTKSGLAPGTYVITESVKPNWIVTTDNPQSVVVVTGESQQVNFGNFSVEHQVPASSSWGMWLMIAGLTGGIALFVIRRNKRSSI